MGMCLDRPSIPEKADRKEEATNTHNVKSMLRFEVASLDMLCCCLVTVMCEKELADKGSKS